MLDLRPISLCNVIYKVAYKVLANRLQSLLLEIVTKSQSAFVKGKLITDNVIIAHKVMHYLKHKREGNYGFGALKLDISKAYDELERGFLEKMLLKLGFTELWVRLIMAFVTIVGFKSSLDEKY